MKTRIKLFLFGIFTATVAVIISTPCLLIWILFGKFYLLNFYDWADNYAHFIISKNTK